MTSSESSRRPSDRLEHFALQHPLRVRWAEADMQGVVFNAHYLAWFDIAATEYWRALAGGRIGGELAEAMHRTFVVRSTLDWHGSAQFDDDLVLAARAIRLGNASFTLRFLVVRDGQVLVTGESVYVHAIDGRSAPLPDAVRARIRAFERVAPG